MRADVAREEEHRKESHTMTTPPAVTLRPCPMCGSAADVCCDEDDDFTHVKCTVCHVRNEPQPTEQESILDWNRRAPLAIDDAAVERACAMLSAQDWGLMEEDEKQECRQEMRSALQAALGEGL